MATNIFLGKPPKYIEDWYKSHSSGKKTIVTYKDGSTQQLLIEGELILSSIPNKNNATKVEIGNLVTSIEAQAFNGCTNLTSVTILGKTLEQIKNIEDGNGNKYYPWGLDESLIVPEQASVIGI